MNNARGVRRGAASCGGSGVLPVQPAQVVEQLEARTLFEHAQDLVARGGPRFRTTPGRSKIVSGRTKLSGQEGEFVVTTVLMTGFSRVSGLRVVTPAARPTTRRAAGCLRRAAPAPGCRRGQVAPAGGRPPAPTAASLLLGGDITAPNLGWAKNTGPAGRCCARCGTSPRCTTWRSRHSWRTGSTSTGRPTSSTSAGPVRCSTAWTT